MEIQERVEIFSCDGIWGIGDVFRRALGDDVAAGVAAAGT